MLSRLYFSARANQIDSEHTRGYKRLLPVCEAEIVRVTMTMDLFQLRAHEGQKIIGEILHTMIEHN